MRSPDIQLEAMTEEDVDEALVLVSTATNEDEGRWARDTMDFHFECLKHGLDDGREYFVWRQDCKVSGLVGLHHYSWGPEENVWLGWFAVHPSCQRRGVGRRLLQLIESIALNMGYRKLFVETYRHSDFDKARQFYAANGFSEVGGVSDYLQDGSDMVVYGKRIMGQ